MTSTFAGFPKGALEFLDELVANNNRDWFKENKPRYESDVLGPALDFITEMENPLRKISPHFRAIPKRSGGSLMRIYRDTRFSKDKTPYKTNVGIHFRHEVGKDVHAPGFYFHFDPEQVFVGAGVWHPDNKSLQNIREFIDESQPRWKRTLSGATFKKTFELHGESLKRPPRGFSPDHPLIDDLKRKDHFGLCELKHKVVSSKTLVSEVTNCFKASKSYMRFLCDALRLPF